MPEFKLTVELVPHTSWFVNLRSLMTTAQWDHVRRDCYKKARHRCEVCGGRGPEHPVECHEKWEYDDEFGLQTLIGTIALCPACHKVKHIGLQASKGPGVLQRSIDHFMKVNQSNAEDTEEYLQNSFMVHRMRNQIDWEVDVSWVENEYPDLFRDNKLKL